MGLLKSLLFVVVIAAYIDAVVSQRENYIHRKTKGYPWPAPVNFTSDPSVTCQVSEQLVFDFGPLAGCDIMMAAEQRTFRYIFGRIRETKRPSSFWDRKLSRIQSSALSLVAVRLNSELTSLPVECQPDHYPTSEMDESYNVQVKCGATPMATVTANSVWGLLRGLETLTQLTYMDDTGIRVINQTTISDKPAFQWRGVLLDTSRHFLPMSILMQNLEIMASNKFNVFHWHIVDDPSFPWVSETFPQLSAAGAYTPVALHTYSPSDVQALINHGRLLGVRIVPEFDTPGHTQSWGSGMPDLLTECYDESGKPDGTYGPLDPSSPTIWSDLATIFGEVFKVFPDQYVHLGGDEVSYEFGCWLNNPRVKELMGVLGISTGAQLQSYYTQQQLRLLDSVSKNQGRYVYWQEVFDSNITLPQDRAVVHVWYANQSALAPITKAGLHGLFSSCWYLDDLGGTRDWTGYYACDPLAFNVTNPSQRDLVIGGEACLWGEYVDSVNVLPRLWPRASAVAERLWTDPRSSTKRNSQFDIAAAITVEDVPDVEWRLEEHRCRMVGRGFPAQPVIGPGFCDVEYRSI